MYPHVTQFQTIDNRRRELLAAETAMKTPARRRRRLLVRASKVTCET